MQWKKYVDRKSDVWVNKSRFFATMIFVTKMIRSFSHIITYFQNRFHCVLLSFCLFLRAKFGVHRWKFCQIYLGSNHTVHCLPCPMVILFNLQLTGIWAHLWGRYLYVSRSATNVCRMHAPICLWESRLWGNRSCKFQSSINEVERFFNTLRGLLTNVQSLQPPNSLDWCLIYLAQVSICCVIK